VGMEGLWIFMPFTAKRYLTKKPGGGGISQRSTKKGKGGGAGHLHTELVLKLGYLRKTPKKIPKKGGKEKG